ncbi:MAG: hypothetical protein CMH04_11290 [Marinovum sp.]|mgnify:CR=1 FL=1|nr:hypothetical protein [Marinovum sp.]
MSNFISLSQAAKEWEVSKGTISTAIKSGALPTKGKTPQGGYKIDKADFLVWYNNDYQNPNKTRSTELNKTVQANSNEPLQNSILEAELKAEREMKKFYKEQVEKLETDRDKWREQAQTFLLTHQPKQEKEEAVTTIKAELPAEPPKDKTAIKAVVAVLVLVAIVGAGLYGLGVVNVSTGQETALQTPIETPQQ